MQGDRCRYKSNRVIRHVGGRKYRDPITENDFHILLKNYIHIERLVLGSFLPPFLKNVSFIAQRNIDTFRVSIGDVRWGRFNEFPLKFAIRNRPFRITRPLFPADNHFSFVEKLRTSSDLSIEGLPDLGADWAVGNSPPPWFPTGLLAVNGSPF